MQVTSYFSILTALCTAKPFASFLFTIFIMCKGFLLFLMNTNRKRFSNQTPVLLFMIPLIIYMITDFAWLTQFYQNSFSKIILRLAWFLQPLQFYSLSLFLKSMTDSLYFLSKKNKIILSIFFGGSLPLIFLPTTLKTLHFLSPNFELILAFVFVKKWNLIQLIIIISGVLFLIKNMTQVWLQLHKDKKVPYILKLQLRYFFLTLIVFMIPETIFAFCNFFPEQQFFVYNSLFLSIIQTASFTFALLFCVKRIYQLRFLNVTPLVQSSHQASNITADLDKAKRILCETKSREIIAVVTAEFLKNNYNVTQNRIILSLRDEVHSKNHTAQRIEQFIQQHGDVVKAFFKESSILVYDELAFTYFYTQTLIALQLLQFLKSINASIFVPLVYGERILGSLVVLKDTTNELFSMHQQTHLSLYATYVTYSIVRLESEQLEDILADRETQILANYKAHQKIARYQESFSLIMNNDTIKKQGLISFKNNGFTFINNIAEELLQLNPNMHHGHPLVKAIKEIVRRVSIYGNPYTLIEKNILGEDISCHGFPYKTGEIIILISRTDALQSLTFENIFVNPSDIDYFIFLYTTQAGSLINTALPAKTTEIQKLRVQLLKIALSKKVICVDVHDDDCEMFVGLIHRITLKKTLHTIHLEKQSIHETICMELFGVQQLDLKEHVTRRGVLQQLDDTGVLYIKNIHFLDLETQKFLVQFIKTGTFNFFRSEQRIFSNVTIICSSTENLKKLTEQGLFLESLYTSLRDATITTPSFVSLPFQEIEALAEGIQKQMITVTEYHQFFGFTQQERENLDVNRPVSLSHLHERVERFIKQRMKSIPMIEEFSTYTPETKFADPILVEAVRLGKQALKDRKIMRELWNKLENQTKIAQLLSVDRSSVYRRCKEFGLIIDKEDIEKKIIIS